MAFMTMTKVWFYRRFFAEHLSLSEQIGVLIERCKREGQRRLKVKVCQSSESSDGFEGKLDRPTTRAARLVVKRSFLLETSSKGAPLQSVLV